MSETLKVSEIYRTIQGESSRSGLPCVMVRLAGCNLSCSWCDTLYAKSEVPREMTLDEILQAVAELNCRRVALTGGEPLCQPAAVELLGMLCEAGYETLLETNGSQDISVVDPHVRRIVDIKCPSSGSADANRWENIEHLTDNDEVKFVIANREDYEFASQAVRDHHLGHVCTVIFSPVWGTLTGAMLAEWILDDDLDVRLGMQLHKLIWPEKDRGV
ncbi:MAG: radical SAM protein [Phycisphaerae bacterium]|nr:radical SAM protein [Phycisphaerae bacterium]